MQKRTVKLWRLEDGRKLFAGSSAASSPAERGACGSFVSTEEALESPTGTLVA